MIFVQVIDDSDAITVFEVPGELVVEPKEGITEEYTNELLNGLKNSVFVKDLFSGDLQLAAKNIISFVSIINAQDQVSSNTSNSSDSSVAEEKLRIKQLFVDIAIQLNASDISSLKVLGSVLSVLSESTAELNTDSIVIKTIIFIKLQLNRNFHL